MQCSHFLKDFFFLVLFTVKGVGASYQVFRRKICWNSTVIGGTKKSANCADAYPFANYAIMQCFAPCERDFNLLS